MKEVVDFRPFCFYHETQKTVVFFDPSGNKYGPFDDVIDAIQKMDTVMNASASTKTKVAV